MAKIMTLNPANAIRTVDVMESKLNLDHGLLTSCRQTAHEIAEAVIDHISGKTTCSVERTVARLLGIDGVNSLDIPIPNVIVDHVIEHGGIAKGLAYWMGNAVLQTSCRPKEIAKLLSDNELNLFTLPIAGRDEIRRTMVAMCAETLEAINNTRTQRRRFREKFGESPSPLIYVLTATGNVYEDVEHARVVAEHGGDIVAITRSTAQSLLDFVPYGPTTEGYGGTFATQANFRIMRQAMDEWSSANNRYIRLSSFCSGLCMPEIAAIGALEGFDNMVNDALYGILYRDINIMRTLIDQRVSRMINGYFGIVINTGEDNYLRTADAVDAAPSVVASQLINYYLALFSGVPEEQIAVGDAFEIDPSITNGLLYQWAQAQLTRELFPNCPVKYMPPTKHMNGNVFRTHAINTLFNLVTIATRQGIQTIGVPTEGVFTPHIHDRMLGLENVAYVFNCARDLSEEVLFKPDGIVQKRANEVLRGANVLLKEILEIGLFKAIENSTFGNVSRRMDEGRGVGDIFHVDEDYLNPYVELMEGRHDA